MTDQPQRRRREPLRVAGTATNLTAGGEWTREDLRKGLVDVWRLARPEVRTRQVRQLRLLGAVLVAVAVFSAMNDGGPLSLAGGVVIAVVFVALSVDALAARLHAHLVVRKVAPRHLEVSVADDAVTYRQDGQVHSYPWDQLRVLDPGDALIFLIQEGTAGFLRMPLRWVPAEEHAAWRAFTAGRGRPAPGGPPSPSG